MDYSDLAADIVKKARAKGADECDCYIEVGREVTIKVRSGEVESIEQASFRGLGLRFFDGKRLGFGFTTDFSGASLRNLIDRSDAFARTSTADPHSGVAPARPIDPGDLEIYDARIDDKTVEEKTDLALACEQAAYDCDKRIKYTYGTSYSDQAATVVLARHDGDPISYRATMFDIACLPVAQEGDERRMGIWLSTERFMADLEPPRTVGIAAAQRAVALLGARSVPTQKAAVVFDQRTGSQVVEEVFESLDGERILRGMSFLQGRLGQKVGSDNASFVDDGRLPRRTGSRPFDAEGIPTGRSLAIDKGIVRSFFYDFRTSKKAATDPTGNARRGYASMPSTQANNFYLLPGKAGRDEVIASVDSGILVTNLLGFGVNITTGDFSRGAEGLWIEKGRIVHPVDEITVSGNLLDMLAGISAVGSDLRFFGRMGSPTFVVDRMTIAGE